MKYLLFMTLAVILLGCHNVKIKDEKYKVSSVPPELGAVGFSSKDLLLQNRFTFYGLPVLKSKIRLNVTTLLFDKNTFKAFKSQYSTGDKAMKISDSVAIKQEYVVFNLLDKHTLLNEYNAEHNKNFISYLRSAGKPVVVTGLAVYLPKKEMEKIKVADAFYLINPQDHKYVIQLYKEGKKTDIVDIAYGAVLAYTTEGFCWDLDSRGSWFPADLNKNGCNGKLKSRIKEKEQTSIYKM